MIDEKVIVSFINSLTRDVESKKFDENNNVSWKIYRYDNEFRCLYKGHVLGRHVEVDIEYFHKEEEKIILRITDFDNIIHYEVDSTVNTNLTYLFESVCSLIESLNKYTKYKFQEALFDANLGKYQC